MSETNKIAISLRISAATVKWFKAQKPRGYQTLMRSVLEEYVAHRSEKQLFAAGRAQEIYSRYYAQCFWHYDRDLKIGPHNIDLVVDGLRKYGGRKGLILAEELCQ